MNKIKFIKIVAVNLMFVSSFTYGKDNLVGHMMQATLEGFGHSSFNIQSGNTNFNYIPGSKTMNIKHSKNVPVSNDMMALNKWDDMDDWDGNQPNNPGLGSFGSSIDDFFPAARTVDQMRNNKEIPEKNIDKNISNDKKTSQRKNLRPKQYWNPEEARMQRYIQETLIQNNIK